MKTPLLVVGACALGIAFTIPATALVVFDPSNYSQNVLTAARTLEQINNQITSLQNQAKMLINQAKNLTSLDFNVLNDLKRTIVQTEHLIGEAKGLSFNVAALEQQFKQLYPQQYTASVSGDQMTQDARARWERSRDALETAMKMQAQVSENLSTDENNLEDLVNRSQSASGILEATQATNQLLALRAKQARAVAEEERAREVRRRFMGSGSSYTPATVRLFRN